MAHHTTPPHFATTPKPNLHPSTHQILHDELGMGKAKADKRHRLKKYREPVYEVGEDCVAVVDSREQRRRDSEVSVVIEMVADVEVRYLFNTCARTCPCSLWLCECCCCRRRCRVCTRGSGTGVRHVCVFVMSGVMVLPTYPPLLSTTCDLLR